MDLVDPDDEDLTARCSWSLSYCPQRNYTGHLTLVELPQKESSDEASLKLQLLALQIDLRTPADRANAKTATSAASNWTQMNSTAEPLSQLQQRGEGASTEKIGPVMETA